MAAGGGGRCGAQRTDVAGRGAVIAVEKVIVLPQADGLATAEVTLVGQDGRSFTQHFVGQVYSEFTTSSEGHAAVCLQVTPAPVADTADLNS